MWLVSSTRETTLELLLRFNCPNNMLWSDDGSIFLLPTKVNVPLSLRFPDCKLLDPLNYTQTSSSIPLSCWSHSRSNSLTRPHDTLARLNESTVFSLSRIRDAKVSLGRTDSSIVANPTQPLSCLALHAVSGERSAAPAYIYISCDA
jgi:hypothetical protein